MALGLPPPPTRADSGDFQWTAWYNQLYTILSTAGSVSWTLVDKAGSSIADLQNKNHGLLTSILGTGAYHVSATEAGRITVMTTMQSKAGDPTITDITASNWALYKNTSSGAVKLWVNDAGVMKSTTLV